MNLGNRTRKQQILDLLVNERGEWVDGSRLATEEVGGSEGLRRLRELVAEGYPIRSRRHPDARRDIWQYRYVMPDTVSPLRTAVPRSEAGSYSYVPAKPTLIEEAPEQAAITYKFAKMPDKIDFGAVAVCPRCRSKTRKYDYPGLEGKRHKDPWIKKKPCEGCNGLGIIPNKGAIPITMPEDQR